MGRVLARGTQAAIDLLALSGAFWLAFLLRFDWALSWPMLRRALILFPYVVAFQYGTLIASGVTRVAWRHVSLADTVRIGRAAAACAVVLSLVRLGAGQLGQEVWVGYQYAALPFGVVVIDAVLAFLAVVGVRAARRLVAERSSTIHFGQGACRPRAKTILIGAGAAGVMVMREIRGRPDLGIDPVGFLDDDPLKVGSVVQGIRVLGTTGDLDRVAASYGIEKALITIANATGKEIRRVVTACQRQQLEAEIIPGLYEIVGGQINLSRIRKVNIDDLLGREPVCLDTNALSAETRGRTVLVTGAGGSIGSELCRQLCRFGAGRLVLVERAENSLYQVHRELGERWRQVALLPCIGDVCDRARMESVFRAHSPEAVFHAAAHKHVPMMEWNPGEAIKNNVFGTRTLAQVADEHAVEKFVMVSTDKAVNPTSIMGASKRIAEIVVQTMSQHSQTRFVAVRFGNVLGSAGSVVPLFQEQIAQGGPITVTHPDVTRYFMTIPEACQLVLQAAAMGGGGEIFVLDMGEPVRIVDLATDLIRLSGLRPGRDIDIAFSGLRPGEKLFEELSAVDEAAAKTRHQKIYIGTMRPHEQSTVARHLAALQDALEQGHSVRLRHAIRTLVPEYQFEEASHSLDRLQRLPDQPPRGPAQAHVA